VFLDELTGIFVGVFAFGSEAGFFDFDEFGVNGWFKGFIVYERKESWIGWTKEGLPSLPLGVTCSRILSRLRRRAP